MDQEPQTTRDEQQQAADRAVRTLQALESLARATAEQRQGDDRRQLFSLAQQIGQERQYLMQELRRTFLYFQSW